MTCTTDTARTYLQPIGALLSEAEALEAQTDASFTTALCIRTFVAFLKWKGRGEEV
jgi:hypothetical protein